MSKSDVERYLDAMHAMQSGVKARMEHQRKLREQGLEEPDQDATSPKHLRVGVNASMVHHAALVQLLIEKGLFTQDEYVAIQADAMEAEVAGHEQLLTELVGKPVRLR